MIIQSKESNIEILEKLNETLVSTKMTEENLKNHKLLIHSLVNIINTKREEIFIMNSKVEIMEKELNFWIYGFEKIKANKRLRDDIKKIQVEKLRKNLEEELKHKRYKLSYLLNNNNNKNCIGSQSINLWILLTLFILVSLKKKN